MLKSQETQEAQENSNEISLSFSLFHPRNLIYGIGKLFFAPIKKIFTRSPFEENNFGSSEEDICNDLSEYFHATYERALIGESYDVNLTPQEIIKNQIEVNLEDNSVNEDVKSKDVDTPNLIEEDPSIRIY